MPFKQLWISKNYLLEKDNKMVSPIAFFIVFVLQDWQPFKAQEHSLPCYLTGDRGNGLKSFPKHISTKVNATKLDFEFGLLIPLYCANNHTCHSATDE